MIIVSVRALRLDEATTSSRFTPEMERCPHTGNVSRLWLFCVSGDRNPHVSNVPEWAARKKTPASLHPTARRLNFDQVSMKLHRQAVRQLCNESEWSAYGRASLLRSHEARWAWLITLGASIAKINNRRAS